MNVLQAALTFALLAGALLSGCGGGDMAAAAVQAADTVDEPNAAQPAAKAANLMADRLATAFAPAQQAAASDPAAQDGAGPAPAIATAPEQPQAMPAMPQPVPQAMLAAPQPAAHGKIVLAYYSGYANNYRALTRYYANFNSVAVDYWNISSHGVVKDNSAAAPGNAIAFLKSKRIDIYGCISNVDSHDKWNATIAHGVTGKYRKAAVANLVAFAQQQGFAGINIDFENVAAADRSNLSQFAGALARALHAAGLKLIMTVPAFSALDEHHPYNQAFDLAALGGAADLIQIMTYDQAIPAWDPGPVAGSDWMKAALTYAVGKAPAGKILNGIPAYGYNWIAAGNGRQVFWNAIPALLQAYGVVPSYDTVSDALTFQYDAPKSGHHTVWAENSASVTQKARLVRTYALAGTSVYALGMEDASFWQALNAGLRD